MSEDKCNNPDCENGKSYLGTNEQGFVVYPKTGKHYSVPCPDCQEPEKPQDHIPGVGKKVSVLKHQLEEAKALNGSLNIDLDVTIMENNILKQQLSEAKAEIKRLKEYTSHKPSCLRYAGSTLEDCTCGLEQALKS